jgi:hypothetical protein
VKEGLGCMQQPHLTTYADIAEVRTVTGAAACNQLLTEGWVLLGVYSLTTVSRTAFLILTAAAAFERKEKREKRLQPSEVTTLQMA